MLEDHFKQCLSSLPVQMISSVMALNTRKKWHPFIYKYYNWNTFSAILFGSKLDLWEHSKLKSCINASLVFTAYFLTWCLMMTSGPRKATLVLIWQVDWGWFRSDVFFWNQYTSPTGWAIVKLIQSSSHLLPTIVNLCVIHMMK